MRKEIPGQPAGIIYSLTIVHEAPSTHEEFAPYTIALVDIELKNGETRRITARLTDLDPSQSCQIDDRVELVTRRLRIEGDRGHIIYGYAARPVLEWDRSGNNDSLKESK